MVLTLPNNIANGDALDATPVQGNFDAIENEINNIEAAQVTDQADIDALQAVMTGGWAAEAATLTPGTADAPSFPVTLAGDQTGKYYPGIRVKGTQTQALSHYWTFNTNSAADVGAATMADIGTPTYTAGKFGNALTLNGSNQALSITDAAGFKPTGEFTIGCWFKTANTGALKYIFQSYSDNTNANGIKISVTAGNLLAVTVGNNAADDASILVGTTTVTDGNWHYAVWSYRNNFSQLYLDGKLEISGYTVTPTYAATNYVRIGCRSVAGSNDYWFNGQIDDLFIINGYALDEQTIKAKYDAGTAQGTGDINLTKYFLCTASSYSAPNTTVTLYGGTDHSLTNAAISNAYYSSQKAPYGFPLNPAKWTVIYQNSTLANQATPTASAWYNLGTSSISVPIGSWALSYSVVLDVTRAAAGIVSIASTLSTANNTAGHQDFFQMASLSGGTGLGCQTTACREVSLSAKTVFYLNTETISASMTNIYNNANGNSTTLKAKSTLL